MSLRLLLFALQVCGKAGEDIPKCTFGSHTGLQHTSVRRVLVREGRLRLPGCVPSALLLCALLQVSSSSLASVFLCPSPETLILSDQ